MIGNVMDLDIIYVRVQLKKHLINMIKFHHVGIKKIKKLKKLKKLIMLGIKKNQNVVLILLKVLMVKKSELIVTKLLKNYVQKKIIVLEFMIGNVMDLDIIYVKALKR